MIETKDKIKKLFKSYIIQVLSGMDDDPRDFYYKEFEASVIKDSSAESLIKTDIMIFDIYDSKEIHYGTITAEVTYDDKFNVVKYVQWAQFYGVANAVEFEDLEECIFDMIRFRDKFTENF